LHQNPLLACLSQSQEEVQNIYYLTQEIAQNFQVEITLQQIKDWHKVYFDYFTVFLLRTRLKKIRQWCWIDFWSFWSGK
jgi:hypothetical protein